MLGDPCSPRGLWNQQQGQSWRGRSIHMMGDPGLLGIVSWVQPVTYTLLLSLLEP